MRSQTPHGIDYHALAEFRYDIRRFLNFSEGTVHAAGIEPQQHQAMLAIKGLPAHRVATISVLAERLLIQHHSAVELVNRLEAKGLIRRARGIADRREVVLTLSARGEKVLKHLTQPHRAELQSAAPKLIRALTAAIAAGGTLGDSRNVVLRKKRRVTHRLRRK
jgi:DNA-binding MarR family transcriptional regulator